MRHPSGAFHVERVEVGVVLHGTLDVGQELVERLQLEVVEARVSGHSEVAPVWSHPPLK